MTKRHRRALGVLCIVALAGALAVVAPGQSGRSGAPMGAPDENELIDRRTEDAIDLGLDSLVATQAADGHWKRSNSVGVTSLVLIGYMINGYFPGERPYGETMEKGLDYLLRESKSGMQGYMGTNMYSHGLATLALSELWGMTDRDDEIRDAIKAGVDVILKAQDRSGGWRYNPEPSGADVSVTAMQLVALNSAKQAGILVPDETINRAIRYVQMCRDAATGGFYYMAGRGTPGFARSAAAVVSLQMCGRHESEEVVDGIKYLHDNSQAISGRMAHWDYGQYYAAIGMSMSSEEDFAKWYPKIQRVMIEKHIRNGKWQQNNSYATAMAMIVLGLPKSYVPAYQR